MPREDVWASGDTYLTAVELVKLGFIVSPTSRSAMGADLLVTNRLCSKTWSVQVKHRTDQFYEHAPIV
jgi:hypothetical protein